MIHPYTQPNISSSLTSFIINFKYYVLCRTLTSWDVQCLLKVKNILEVPEAVVGTEGGSSAAADEPDADDWT